MVLKGMTSKIAITVVASIQAEASKLQECISSSQSFTIRFKTKNALSKSFALLYPIRLPRTFNSLRLI